MQHATALHGVSFREAPRPGQLRVFNHPKLLNGTRLNVNLPTGYGKTFTATGCYAIRQRNQMSTRLLYIVPRDGQLEQFRNDGPREMTNAGVQGPVAISDLRYWSLAQMLKAHRENTAQVFATTIQSLCEARGSDNCRKLMETGQWMVVIDEHHHYGVDKTWGRKIATFPHSFLLAMSATPWRPDEDGALGVPDVAVTYRQAVEEGVVKPLKGHAYHYRLDTIDDDGNIVSYTTEELVEAAGGDSAEQIERFRIERKMRWSPKYVSPLVRVPIERMEPGCQALVSAMCVSHAELVCSQLRGMFPELRIDWVGTGTNGRTPDENKKIRDEFCPPKDEYGNRKHKLDVLVHVDSAGEGLDSVNVSEIVFLRSATQCNRTNQVIGRASRPIKGRKITANVNFDASTDLVKAGYISEKIMDAIDDKVVNDDDNPPPTEPDYPEPPELPTEPYIALYDLELLKIDSGDPGLQRWAEVVAAQHQAGTIKDVVDLAGLKADPSHPQWKVLRDTYIIMRQREAEIMNPQAVAQQWDDAVEAALRNITGLILSLIAKPGMRIEKSLPGDIKKRINGRKRAACGGKEKSLETLQAHYHWLKGLERDIRATKKLPGWLQ